MASHRTPPLDRLETSAVRATCAAMLALLPRIFAAASRVDPAMRREIAGLPADFTFEMGVEATGPAFRIRRVGGDDALEVDPARSPPRPMLSIRFKHLRHAFAVLTFREGTLPAFAAGRLVVDGDPALAMRMVRIFDRMQELMLPSPLARHVLGRPPAITLSEQVSALARTYARLVAGFLERAPS